MNKKQEKSKILKILQKNYKINYHKNQKKLKIYNLKYQTKKNL